MELIYILALTAYLAEGQIHGNPVQGGNPYRIVGGEEAVPHSWPWQVGLSIWDWYTWSFVHLCGGSLISPEWLVTAAHCVHNERAQDFLIRMGDHIHSSTETHETHHQAVAIIKHINYNSTFYTNDIALIKFDPPVQITEKKFPVNLPKTNVAPGSNCTVTGWGDTYEGVGGNEILNEVQVPIISQSVCNSSNYYNGDISHGMMCAGYSQGGKDTCQGDSGGPLVCQSATDGQWYLHGITSWGDGCAQPNKPGVYTDVFYFKQWIEHQVINSGGSNCLDPSWVGPHSPSCLMSWWYGAGCTERGWHSPNNVPQSQLDIWNTMNAGSVRQNMSNYYLNSNQGSSGHGTTYEMLCGNCGPDDRIGPHSFSCLMRWWREARCHDSGLMSPAKHNCALWHTQTVSQVKADMQLYAENAREGGISDGGWSYRLLCGTPVL